MSLVSVWDLDTHFKVCHFSDLHAKDTGLFYVHSSGEWDDCNYLSLKISGCVYWSQRGAHGCAEKYIPKKKNTDSIGEKKYGIMGEERVNTGLEPRKCFLTCTNQ